ncbi:hypothetical protein COW36_16260 [bacterium (Candidatus Blackallbacteria) CG17_big_fil_post_rev_8_21_14_2_50_48_46]|uniref:Uncharacterized protein n=1 Tax=bacterium (Candidatus Blackallbacteria) CG17_big_fil_post_rev_8_21_14_2_50_48_46 TaxID=2014261 RepID=A0A2M7G1R9_9BACT|nr:MAG: hypothetical protein COW64_16730 [bacterium (Candidatus Blackallbacteria) CG18_big_fil_WC_8_21_14_2_50_49_26]PIW15689.1 MAG: hypothetical protein COW36_16260 [bacterium (Candidatus Blackallbacteria) CG17_big_fil_post_rev_8_21_14_2_50_48_46]PIW48694.1 MAG: hypothetical protein COW20_08440 [bacterium (Candidatus Blackallbacteria) CG13_big_fil_rev_8_21_14_2_50_49_14]
MNQRFQGLVLTWLKETLYPLALQVAQLPPETLPADLLVQILPLPNTQEPPFYDTLDARTYCSECPLFCAVLLARDLLSGAEADVLVKCIWGLIWRDAQERAVARDLDFATNGFDLPSAEYAARFDQADAQWQRWLNMSETVRTSWEDLLSDYADQRLWSLTFWSGEP